MGNTMLCPKCGGWMYERDDFSVQCDTCNLIIKDGGVYDYSEMEET